MSWTSSSSIQGPPVPSGSQNAEVTLSANVATCTGYYPDNEVILSTALIKLYDSQKREHTVRALLDSGSTSCIISQRIYDLLKLPTHHINKSIMGISNTFTKISKMCYVQIKSLNDQFSANIQCLVLPSIVIDTVPSHQINISNINVPSNISLADPYFHCPADIDMIIGADIFWDVLGSQRLSLGPRQPILYETKFGWLVSGPINSKGQVAPSHHFRCNFTRVVPHTTEDDIQNQLMRFWQLEEVSLQSSLYSQEEKLCEEHFVKNTVRLQNGRFCVKIPLKDSPTLLGDSFQRAKGCFLSLERRLHKLPVLKKMYQEFMLEYEQLGHMSKLPLVVAEPHDCTYYIPHHGILRENSTTTKLRAVFNASSPTSSGVSLNAIQMVGPVVQDDLLSILLRFRQHRFVLTADVEKMYRQVSVHPDDRCLQHIIWRDNSDDNLNLYELNTVTYGTASAPFLATRCLTQIGLECKDEMIRNVITHDFYIDDLLTGGDSIDDVIHIRDLVTRELANACMPLRKWKSNDPQLICKQDQTSLDLNIGSNEPNKTLGLGWQIDTDSLCFPIGSLIPQGNTKRVILSAISQIFDPLGLLAPCVITMKMLLQTLWLRKLSWDDELPIDISQVWSNIIKTLPTLNNIHVPRHVIYNQYQRLELHIFTDASERAYGACAYVRSLNPNGDIQVRLLIAKSRVAPIKPTTIPRLELCAALAGSRLYDKVINSLRCQFQSVTFWTDSMIVLGWLKMLPIKLQPFVRNRVADILERTNSHTWRHVPTTENPADLVSRGINFNMLESLELWWSGPAFLKDHSSNWPSNPGEVDSLPETRHENISHLGLVTIKCSNESLCEFERFSNLSRLNRAVAYALRFINACKNKSAIIGPLTKEELSTSLNVIIKLSQNQSFPEYQMLYDKKKLPIKSQLIKFNVFLDDNDIMRVGGRLGNSEFPYSKKYPIILQSTHHVTKLLFRFEHHRLMHAGPQQLLASIRESYWPIGGRNLARACYRQCVRCSRTRGRTVASLMGNLPKDRVTPSYPFENVGVDYAGPIMSASRQGRGCRLVKVYIVIFVCFATKAIHLELVGDLTSNNFLASFRRFISRRGKPTHLYSDNGTSFVGAYNELAKFLKGNTDILTETAANDGINFHFIPAYSPHFGGLWEAGVKSTKYHLNRVLGDCKLTYEELYTTLVQIEAILNSRPLTPLSTSPDDLTPLTPGHFIIGRPLTCLPSQDITDYSSDHLTRFQRVEQLRQHFWARWSKEYISELQQRVKWFAHNDPLKINSLVLIKEDGLPPLKWKMGRIIELFPGHDGISRVSNVKTAAGVIRRSFSKLCPLLQATDSVERELSTPAGNV